MVLDIATLIYKPVYLRLTAFLIVDRPALDGLLVPETKSVDVDGEKYHADTSTGAVECFIISSYMEN